MTAVAQRPEVVACGGYRQSGMGGKEKSLAAFDRWTGTKTVWCQVH